MNDRPDKRNGGMAADSGSNGPPAALIVGIIVAVMVGVFILRNRSEAQRVQIDFLFFELDSKVWTLIAVSIGLGIVLDRLFSRWWRRRKRSTR